MRPMKRVLVERALRRAGCRKLREGAEHTLWHCDCGQGHKTAVPRHREISAGVVGNMIKDMPCRPEGWLQ